MAWTSADENAQLASDYVAPTREQATFDAHAKAVVDLGREIRLLTQCGPNWPQKSADAIARMVELASDLRRELSVLAIEGARPIPSRSIPLATFDQVQLKAAE